MAADCQKQERTKSVVSRVGVSGRNIAAAATREERLMVYNRTASSAA